MNLTSEDKRLLEELCQQHGVSADKVLKLLDTVRDYEFKERRTGVYDALREILKRSGVLDGGPKIALPGDDPQSVVVSPSTSSPPKRAEILVSVFDASPALNSMVTTWCPGATSAGSTRRWSTSPSPTGPPRVRRWPGRRS